MRFPAVLAAVLAASLCAATATAAEAPPTRKSPAAAFALSFAGTALSVGTFMAGAGSDSSELALLGAAGILFAPSAGHWYAEKPFTAGLGLRLAGTAGLATVLLTARDRCLEECGVEWPIHLFVASAVVFASGALLDIVTAPFSAKGYNKRNGIDVSVAPVAIRTASGPAWGLGIGGRFQ
jgi:hypothetical protein